MIYLPHPKFDFDGVGVISGGIIGVCFTQWHNAGPPAVNRLAIPLVDVDVESVINRFPKAISLYWLRNKTQSVSLGFVREDGAEFAIRFLKSTVFAPNGYGEIIGYWKDIVWSREPNTLAVTPLSVWPDDVAPAYILKREYDRQEYAKFVEWLVSQT